MYFVHTMNYMPRQLDRTQDPLLIYQAQKLQDLIRQIVECCEDRKLYETQRFGLPYAEIRCLVLFQGERYLTVKGIAQKLEVAKSRVTKIVDGLIERGLVKRMGDPKDARFKLVSLTPEGLRKSEEIESFHRHLHYQILAQLDPAERRELLSHLDSLRAAMEAVKTELMKA
ncbi:MAG: MarR family winged helix-turn-helix transcriptional regulator [candidate division NC10 bacterium]|nr:MarR family winged helix-turn-helix transcriptional regulator [candidate division NC10 bacterium]